MKKLILLLFITSMLSCSKGDTYDIRVSFMYSISNAGFPTQDVVYFLNKDKKKATFKFGEEVIEQLTVRAKDKFHFKMTTANGSMNCSIGIRNEKTKTYLSKYTTSEGTCTFDGVYGY